MPFDRQDVKLQTSDGRHFELLEPFAYTTGAGETLTVPTGFRTDGASTPNFLWEALPPFGKYFMPAVLHDFLYQTGLFVRSKCDKLFLEAMRANKVNWLKAQAIYWGVRVGGWKAYEKYRKQENRK